ncbi:MAG: hypothetical protein NZM13_07925 [Cyclobacteriaceae bacterium]|nr:hypothetical protein [Cyclobacteriaceae bacterium]MDW8331531.1 hypothetical protein [Cyclobacteriaceae bacterium]
MISVTGQTFEYILQPALISMHRETRAWLSATDLWKRELAFFQKILDHHSTTNPHEEFKKQIDHFQHLITYYNGELVDAFRKKLRDHEKRLAIILNEKKESDTRYFKEHSGLMEEVQSFADTFTAFKQDFFNFIERGFSPYK